jgi:Ca-activated chloride channel family protein
MRHRPDRTIVRTQVRLRIFVVVACLLAAWLPQTGSAQTDSPPAPSSISVRITSPLGRTGTPVRVRIVAQIHPANGGKLQSARFFVDGNLLGEVIGGPPYSVEWADENPFVRREIVVQAQDDEGNTGEDKVVLQPFEIVENTQVTAVLVEAAVYSKKGRFVTGLDDSSFSLREDDVPQKLDIVAQEAIPATFALLVDSSQSMSRRFDFVREAAGRVVSYLRSRDQVLVAPFSNAIGTVTGPTNDRDTVRDAISTIAAKGGTAIHDCLIEIAGRLAGVPGRRAVILVTDGYDENSKTSAEEAVEALKKAEVTTYIVAVAGVAGISLKGERMLHAIAAATGGAAFFPRREEDLVEVYDTLTTDAQYRYLVTYTPSNQRLDGKWRRISLVTKAEGQVVQSRDGYFAPKPPPIRPSLEFTVMDLKSRYLEVTRDDLMVLEDGAEQTIETFQEAVEPVSIVLALDASGSMKKVAQTVMDAARAFVLALRPADSLTVMIFEDKAVLAHAPATNREWSLEAIAQYKADGGTALYDALYDSLQQLKGLKGRSAIVVLTDGRDEDRPGKGPGSVHSYEDVLRVLRETGVTTFTVGLGTKIDAPLLQELARLSGGQAYFPTDVSQLSEQYSRVLENLSRRYILGYTSTNTARDGSWRKVEIRSRREGVLVAAKSGYFAPDR